MTDFILYLFLNSLFIWGVNCVFSEDHLLERQGEWMFENLPEWLYKPLIGCAACMASVWGTIGYVLHDPFFPKLSGQILLWPVYCTCLCGFNFLLIKLTNRKREVKISTDEDF